MTRWIGLEVEASSLAAAVADWWAAGDEEAVLSLVVGIDACVADPAFTEALIERLMQSLELETEAS